MTIIIMLVTIHDYYTVRFYIQEKCARGVATVCTSIMYVHKKTLLRLLIARPGTDHLRASWASTAGSMLEWKEGRCPQFGAYKSHVHPVATLTKFGL